MLGSFGFPELLIILVIVVVLFGVRKLPLLGKGLGEGIRNFKDSIRPSDDSAPSDGETDGETGKSSD
ncbi:MAG: twin-arginine translocase TatA/TatE family subunit [bacterium]|nr:twin-arginine translocase TatA/TatE family subunit [bacterium]